MSKNRTVKDLKVKQLKVKRKHGSNWSSVSPKFNSSEEYRFDIVFGNRDGRIDWPGDKYDKENIRITLLPKGAKIGSRYQHQNAIKFYTNDNYSSLQDGNGKLGKIEYKGPYKSDHADIVLHSYFKVSSGLNGVPIHTYRWRIVISAAVRNNVARYIYCSP